MEKGDEGKKQEKSFSGFKIFDFLPFFLSCLSWPL